MAKEIVFGKEAREGILKGASIVSNAASSTLGPFGKNVVIKKEYNDPHVTNDGVTVINHIRLKDQLEDIGALLVRQASRKTNDNSGDGTTTTALLTYNMIKNAMDIKLPPIRDVRLAFSKHLSQIKEFVQNNKVEYENKNEMLRHVSMISSNMDMELTDSLMNVYKDLGEHADIIVEDSPSMETTYQTFRGMYFEGGYKAKEFITDAERELCIMENVALIITDKKISSTSEIQDITRNLLGAKFSVLFISPEVSGEAMVTLTRTAVKHPGKIAVVKSPGINVRRSEMLEDISIYTGGQVIKESMGESIDEAMAHKKYNGKVGLAEKVVIRKDSVTIIQGKFDEDKLNERVKILKNRRDEQSDSLMKERFSKRISGLTSGVGIIYIGGASEVEIKEKKDRMDDCIRATKSAMEMGVSLGGGYLLREYALKKIHVKTEFDKAIKNTLLSPAKTIWEINGERQIPKRYKQYLKKNDIIDPIKVIWDCVNNSMAIAYAILSTNAIVINDKESDEILGDLPNIES